MTSIVLKNPVNGHENGEEIEVDIFLRDYEGELEVIETNKGIFVRKWEDYTHTDPFGWQVHFIDLDKAAMASVEAV